MIKEELPQIFKAFKCIDAKNLQYHLMLSIIICGKDTIHAFAPLTLNSLTKTGIYSWAQLSTKAWHQCLISISTCRCTWDYRGQWNWHTTSGFMTRASWQLTWSNRAYTPWGSSYLYMQVTKAVNSTQTCKIQHFISSQYSFIRVCMHMYDGSCI